MKNSVRASGHRRKENRFVKVRTCHKILEDKDQDELLDTVCLPSDGGKMADKSKVPASKTVENRALRRARASYQKRIGRAAKRRICARVIQEEP